MQPVALRRKLGGEVTVDVCTSCQGIWFDAYESLQLAPVAVVELFRLIHASPPGQRNPLATALTCPRCAGDLDHARDIVRSGRFNYYRCAEHGRFISFAQFMVEKGFVRQLTPGELKQLRPEVVQLRCSSCGAPVDIRRDSACAHCGAPLAILDADAVAKALAGYLGPEVPAASLSPALAAGSAVARARRPTATQNENAMIDLVVEGASTLCEMLGT
jgi:hypothetical protein